MQTLHNIIIIMYIGNKGVQLLELSAGCSNNTLTYFTIIKF